MDPASPPMKMAMGATSAMAIPSSAADPMSMPSSNMMMSMESMIMVFFTSTNTALWSSAFTPNTTGQYAGACIFLIAFAVMFRMLLALRFNLYKVVAVVKQRRSGGLLQPDVTEIKATPRTWRASEAILSGALDTVIAGVSYLLMMAAMTMNVGYFLSVLGGVFLGSVLCSHLAGSAGGH
ncbi:Ctr copper transporter family domain-containing protein [Trichoderma pleuroticola]